MPRNIFYNDNLLQLQYAFEMHIGEVSHMESKKNKKSNVGEN